LPASPRREEPLPTGPRHPAARRRRALRASTRAARSRPSPACHSTSLPRPKSTPPATGRQASQASAADASDDQGRLAQTARRRLPNRSPSPAAALPRRAFAAKGGRRPGGSLTRSCTPLEMVGPPLATRFPPFRGPSDTPSRPPFLTVRQCLRAILSLGGPQAASNNQMLGEESN
jgi:hypothetical protein